MRTWLRRFSILCCLFAFVTPAWQGLFLSAATSLEVGLLWALLVPTSLILGTMGWWINRKKEDANRNGFLGWISLCLLGGILIYHLYFLVSMSWTRYIGPRAEIIVPKDFEGIFGIYLKNPLEPSIKTAGQKYVYEVPADGALQKDTGWVGVSFGYKNGQSVAGVYSTHIHWSDGSPMTYSDFSCAWVQDQWMEKEVGGPAWVSAQEPWGIACKVSRNLRKTAITTDEAMNFFRARFKIEGRHNQRLPPTRPERLAAETNISGNHDY